MKRLVCMLLCLAAFGMAEAQRLTSPDGGLSLDFHLSPDGVPVYSLQYKGKTVIGESRMGFRNRFCLAAGVGPVSRHPRPA